MSRIVASLILMGTLCLSKYSLASAEGSIQSLAARPANQETNNDSTQERPRLMTTGTCMGPIPYSVILVAPPDSVDQAKLDKVVKDGLQHINQLMSTYVEDSDVSRFNDSRSTDFISVDRETALVVSRAVEISRLSEGAFDITVGPAVNLWNFGPDKDEIEVPDNTAIANVKRIVGYQKLEVRMNPPGIKKEVPELRIDLSAIAKGYAVDVVAKRLKALGCEDFMVEVGGEVRCVGRRHTGGMWRVGVEKPDAIAQVPEVIAELDAASMATSGDYRNYRRVGKMRYSHTINPTTCRPVTNHMASACIIAEDCMTADALATTVMVLGLEKGRAFLEKAGVQYFVVERDSDFGTVYYKASSQAFPVAGGNLEPLNTVKKEKFNQSIWPIFLASAGIFGIVILGMAFGAIFNNKPVQGSCGGIANVTNEDGESNCSICSKPTTDCVELPNV